MTSLEIQIMAYLRTHPPAGIRDLGAALSGRRQDFAKAIRSLASAGIIRRVGDAVPAIWEPNPEHGINRIIADMTGGKDDEGKEQPWIE